MNVLLYVPQNPGRPQIHPATLGSINRLTWPWPLTITFQREDHPGEEIFANVTAKYQLARRLALAGGYDALFTVEADMILPADALARLAAVDADVAYGLYCSRHEGVRTHYRWLAFSHAGEQRAMSLGARPSLARKQWGQVVETQGVGMGCALIHRHVLSRIDFRTHPEGITANDWTFSLDLQTHGFRQVHDLGVVCGHILADNCSAVWPDRDAPELAVIRPIEKDDTTSWQNRTR